MWADFSKRKAEDQIWKPMYSQFRVGKLKAALFPRDFHIFSGVVRWFVNLLLEKGQIGCLWRLIATDRDARHQKSRYFLKKMSHFRPRKIGKHRVIPGLVALGPPLLSNDNWISTGHHILPYKYYILRRVGSLDTGDVMHLLQRL